MPGSVLFPLLLAVAQQAAPLDTADLRDKARAEARRYEASLRRDAPFGAGGSPGYCDEHVGRFCLWYDAGRQRDLPPEPKAIRTARVRAIEAHAAALAALPGDSLLAASLVRYLVEHDSTSGAVNTARAFKEATEGRPWGRLLLGLAYHLDRNTPAAEEQFRAAIPELDKRDRHWLDDLRHFLSSRERKAWEKLGPEGKEIYAGRLWRLADPLYLTPGNESWAEHVSRLVWSKLLASAPSVWGSTSWGDDLTELTMRYGVPKARLREFGTAWREGSIIESYDPDQQNYIPDALSVQGLNGPPLPGSAWPLDTIRSRSGYSPPTLREMQPLEHQLTFFPRGDSVLVRVDAIFPLDSAARAAPRQLRLALFVADTLGRVLAENVRNVAAAGDTASGSVDLMVAPGLYLFSVEAIEPETRLARRARYLADTGPASPPALSDILITTPFPPGFTPTTIEQAAAYAQPDLILPLPRTGVFFEIVGLTTDSSGSARYRIEISMDDPRRPGLLTRAFRRLGLADEKRPQLTSWSETRQPVDGKAVVGITIDSDNARQGLRRIKVTVTDELTGSSALRERIVLIRR